MGFFDFLKSNVTKIAEIKESEIDSFLDVRFNENISTFNRKDFEDLCDKYIVEGLKAEQLLKKASMLRLENNKILTVLSDITKIESTMRVEEKDAFDEFKNSFKEKNELLQMYMEKKNYFQIIVNEYRDVNESIEKSSERVIKFNLFYSDSKKVKPSLKKIKPRFEDLSAIGEARMQMDLIEKYMDTFEYLSDAAEGKIFLPYDNRFEEFTNFWINQYAHLNFDNFSLDLHEKMIREEDQFDFFKRVTWEIKSYKSDIKEGLNDLEKRISVNPLISTLFEKRISDMNKKYSEVSKQYLSRSVHWSKIQNDFIEINNEVRKIDAQYSKIISPIQNTLNMLQISKKDEIESISDYYIYSLSKSIERSKNMYGRSKQVTQDEVEQFIKIVEEKLYILTNDQRNAIYESVDLLNQNYTASCLIQGDVSSGKTIVTVALMFILALKGMKSVYIIPRAILRSQHLNTLKKYNDLFGLNLRIYDSKEEFDISEADIVLNGYSFSDKMFSEVEFDLGVIDEIQLFGVEQREQVQMMYPNIDMFYTTATPHPRTKLISLIGNIDIVEIREMPPGRKLKKTRKFNELNEEHVKLINSEASKGNMTLVVCPLVNKSGFSDFESLPTAFKKYKSLFPHLRVEKLEARMSETTKDEIIKRSVDGEVDILVASKTIEVGVDIPRASVIFIHYPHTMGVKWGVSQLHQLRGRVGRSNQDSYCFIEAPADTKEGSAIDSVIKTQDVFELTKNDFNWRGFEKIIGTKQSGRSGSKKDQEKRIEAYTFIAKNTHKMVKALEEDFLNQLADALESQRVVNIN